MVSFTGLGSGRKLNLNRVDNLKELNKLGLTGKPPTGTPPGTVPIGNGFYTTPNTPADPMDCTRYPNSPWCSFPGIDLKKPASLDIEPSVHACGFDIEMSGSVGFGIIQFPTNKFSYRYEGECRKDPPPPEPPPPPRTAGVGVRTFNGGDDSNEGYFFTATNYTEWGYDENSYGCITLGYPQFISLFSNFDRKWVSGFCPKNKPYPLVTGTYTEVYSGEGSQRVGITDCFEQVSTPPDGSFGIAEHRYQEGYNTFFYGVDDLGRVAWRQYEDNERLIINPSVIPVATIQFRDVAVGFQIWKGQWGYIRKYLEVNTTRNEYSYRDIHVDFYFDLLCGTFQPHRKNPPPDPPDKNCDCMSCCNDPRDNKDDYSKLLRQLLVEIQKANKAIGSDRFPVQATIFDEDENKQKAQGKNIKLDNIASSITKIIDRNEKLSKIIGIDTFPLELPESVIVHPENDNLFTKALNFLNPFKNVKIYSVMDLLVWKIKQDSAVLGQWGQVIKVSSTEKKKVTVDGKEIEKEVEKEEEVVLPNIAQTMKETILLQSQLLKNNGLVLDCVIKLMIELAQTKSISAETVKRVEDIQQYLDYPTNEKTVDVPVQITFPNPKDPPHVQNDLYKLLKEGKITITFDDWTGEHSQDEKFLDLLQAAKVIQGVYFNKTQ